MFAIANECSSPIQEVAPDATTACEPSASAGAKTAREEAGTELVTSDEALVERARRGDKPAFGELIQRHRNACLKRARLMIRDRSDAEDEVQNAFWKAYLRLEQYRGEGSFGAWLSRIVENQCLMRIRDQRNVRFVYLDEPTESNVRLEVVGQTPDPEGQLGLSEVGVLLKKEINRIPPLLRNVMLLRDVDQLSMFEIADRLGLSLPAAKSRLRRARMEMKSRISSHCGRKGVGTLTQTAKYNQAAYTRAS